MTGRIDLNADLGEECGDDAAMLALVTSTSLAAGGHAGGGLVLAQAIAAAHAAGVAVGAHPSYPDRVDFGRTSHLDRHGLVGVRTFVTEQVRLVAAACDVAGVELAYVKAHGALYGDVAGEADLAQAYLDGIADAAGPIAVLGPGASALAGASTDRGIRFVPEAFADRRYRSDGTLVPRSAPAAVHSDPRAVAAQALALARGEAIEADDGSRIAVDAQSLCIHGDSPGAVAFARAVRSALESAGVRIEAPWGTRP